jgi:protein-disulfide isomerase
MAKNKKKKTVYKPKKSSNKGFILIIAGIFVLAAILLFFVSNQDPNGDDGGASNTDIDISYEGQPSKGEEDAPVKILEFADFKCPACGFFEETVYPKIQKDYIDSGKVELFMVNKPFIGPDSVTAAEVGEAVFAQDEEAFWKYYELVFENQKDEKEKWATEEFLIGLIEDYIEGIDIEKLKSDLESGKFEDEVEADKEMSASIQSTPTIFINGKMIEDPFDYEGSIKPAIEEALKANE